MHLCNTSGFCVDHSLVDTRDRQGTVGRQTRMLGVNETARGNVLSLYGTNDMSVCLCVWYEHFVHLPMRNECLAHK